MRTEMERRLWGRALLNYSQPITPTYLLFMEAFFSSFGFNRKIRIREPLSNTPESCKVNQLPLIVFDKHTQDKGFHTVISQPGPMKTTLQVGSFKEPPDQITTAL